MYLSSVRHLLFFLAVACSTYNSGRAQTGDSPTNEAPPATPPVSTNSPAATSPETASRVATLTVADLREYEMQSPAVQQLIAGALHLTTLDLAYQYGSSDPTAGGMDCSGTVYYLLHEAGMRDVPRDSSGMYKWVWLHSRFQAVTSPNPDTFELAPLQPGDLLFWTGTYQVDRDPPVTHVMIYLGINRHTGHRVMFGASEGRPFNNKSRFGVSVFDFVLPGRKQLGESARFIGYGAIPGLGTAPQK